MLKTSVSLLRSAVGQSGPQFPKAGQRVITSRINVVSRNVSSLQRIESRSRLLFVGLGARNVTPDAGAFAASSRTYFWSSKPKEAVVAPDVVPVPTPPTGAVPPPATVQATAPGAAPSPSPAPPASPSPIVETTVDAGQAASTAFSASSTTPSFIVDPTVLDTTTTTLIDTATTQSTLTAITHIGDLKLIGLASNWTPSGWCQKLFEAVYVTTGLPWWASLMVGTILLRVALLPLTLKGLRAGAILHNISPQTEPIKAEMMRASANKDMVEQTRTRQKLLKLHEDAGVSFFSPFWGVIQGPVALFAFLGIRKMVAAPVPGLETGGAFWFTDLTVADPTYILPLAAVVGLMATLELGAESGGRPMPSGMRNFLRALMVGGFFFTAQLPAAVFMYWIAANLISLLQVLAVNNPTIRAKYLHIPPIDKNVTPKRQTMSALAKLGVSDAKWMVNKAAEERRVREEYAQRAVERMKAKAAGLRRDW